MASHKTSIRIVFVTEEYPPDAGGVATSAQRVARNLTRLGHQVCVLSFDTSRPVTVPSYVVTETDQAVAVRRIGPFFRKVPGPVAEDEDSRAMIRRRIFDKMESVSRDFRPQLVLSFFAGNSGLLGGYLSRSLGIPHVLGIRGLDAGQYIFSIKHLALLSMITKSATRIVCVNEHLKGRLLLAFPEYAAHTSVIHNSVELPEAVAMRRPRRYIAASAGWPPTAVVATFIGSPREKKGTAGLVEALDLARKSADIRLLIIGSDFRADDRSRCGDLVDRLKSEGAIHVTGYVPRNAAMEIAAEADIVVMPSLDDGLPNGLLEGMAVGLCPIVSDLFNDLVVDGSTGWVVERDNPPALAGALISAAQLAEKRELFGAAAKAYIAKSHQPAVEAGAYASLFGQILGSASPA